MATDHHAEHVGSLLRPPELLAARSAGDPEALREAEDRAALAAIGLQREAGIEIFTDGEVRRTNWMAGMLEAIGGVIPAPNPGTRWFRDGVEPPHEETDWESVTASGKLHQKRNLTSVEAGFLAAHAPGRFKITMISSSMGHLMWRPGVSDAAYPTVEDMLRDLVALQTAEIERLIDEGVTWIQLDSLGYNFVIDEDFRRNAGAGDASPDRLLEATVAIDAGLVRAAKAKSPGVTVGMHICRGNNRSAYMSSGGYDPVAEKLFGGVGVDRFLLEYDTERAGGFEPLRFVPKGTTVVLGLVSSKVPALESSDELCRRIEEASKYVSIEDLALSPQCGFASTSRGNLLTIDEEKRKLELVVETARRVWG